MSFRYSLSSLRIDGFMLGMLGAVVLGALYPAIGASGGVLHLQTVTTVGVSLVFLLSGAGLSTERLRAGAANWRLHLLVQLSTYGLFPLIGLALTRLAAPWLPAELLSGFFFLCVLPSTISTSIAMTSLARGNVAGAIFNATLSALLGMVLTPLLMGLWQHAAGQSAAAGAPSLLDQFLSIAEQLLLPFAAGQFLRRWIGKWIERNKAITSKVDRGTILLIVYNSFCDAAQAGLWRDYGVLTLLQVLLITGTLLALVLTLTRLAARRAGFNVEDEIAAVFCGSKKSLATGVPMAKLMFAGSGGATLGLIVLPIMFYHQLQLIVCSTMARRYADRD